MRVATRPISDSLVLIIAHIRLDSDMARVIVMHHLRPIYNMLIAILKGWSVDSLCPLIWMKRINVHKICTAPLIALLIVVTWTEGHQGLLRLGLLWDVIG